MTVGNWIHVRSPHGTWDVKLSLYPTDSLPAATLVGHATRQLVPESQQRYIWYLMENGRRLEDDDDVYADRERDFTLAMEMP